MKQKGSISDLKDLLFEEEKNKYQELSQKLKQTTKEIDEKLANRKVPEGEFNDILERIVKVMPDKLGPTITATLKSQIRESRDEVVQALFPIIGQMIKKYVQQEIQLLSDKIDEQYQNIFSSRAIKLYFKSLVSGIPYNQLVLQNSKQAEIKEIFIIEEGSGLLLASYSRGHSFDQDMVAGMLTAIKTFVEDAMETEPQNLEMISYDTYKIYVQSFKKCYIGVVLEGVIATEFKRKLDDRLMKFVRDVMNKSKGKDENELSTQIDQYFQKI